MQKANQDWIRTKIVCTSAYPVPFVVFPVTHARAIEEGFG